MDDLVRQDEAHWGKRPAEGLGDLDMPDQRARRGLLHGQGKALPTGTASVSGLHHSSRLSCASVPLWGEPLRLFQAHLLIEHRQGEREEADR
jgi:hypothetical protein